MPEKSDNRLVNWLFETKAVRVCPEDKPFWYTSGTIGPYYINTHFLYGSEEKANDLLQEIDTAKADRLGCPGRLLELLRSNYREDPIYRGMMDVLIEFLKSHMDLEGINYISGGERRDWFFSLIAAEKLGKPHLTIYKDLSSVLSIVDPSSGLLSASAEEISVNGDGTREVSGAVLHIADLITEASSYERAWIPAVKSLGGNIAHSAVVVDRLQGGGELLERHGVKSHALVSIDEGFFTAALEQGHINPKQYDMLLSYRKKPKESMKEFLEKHPGFMEASLNGDEKTRERAKLCLEKGFYK